MKIILKVICFGLIKFEDLIGMLPYRFEEFIQEKIFQKIFGTVNPFIILSSEMDEKYDLGIWCYPDLVQQRFLDWLRPEGVEWWIDVYKKYNTLLAVWDEGGVPHCVHFREGMQVRNWMRNQKEFKNKDAHWLDNHWAEFVMESIANV